MCVNDQPTPDRGADQRLSLSEAGKAHFRRLGVIAQSHVADYELAISGDGGGILVATDDASAGGTVFERANRLSP